MSRAPLGVTGFGPLLTGRSGNGRGVSLSDSFVNARLMSTERPAHSEVSTRLLDNGPRALHAPVNVSASFKIIVHIDTAIGEDIECVWLYLCETKGLEARASSLTQ